MKHIFAWMIIKQNILFWASGKPRLTVANPLHPERITVLCDLPSVGIFGPEFNCSTTISVVCLSLLNVEFVHLLRGVTFEWMEPCFNKMVPDHLTPGMPTSLSSWRFGGESSVESVVVLSSPSSSWIRPCVFYSVILKSVLFSLSSSWGIWLCLFL